MKVWYARGQRFESEDNIYLLGMEASYLMGVDKFAEGVQGVDAAAAAPGEELGDVDPPQERFGLVDPGLGFADALG